MAVPAAVDAVDHAGQGGGLSGSGRAGNQHQPLFVLREGEHAFRNSQFRRVGQPEPDHTNHCGQRTPLTEHIYPETSELRHRERKVIVDAVVQIGTAPVAEFINGVNQRADIVRTQKALRGSLLTSAAFIGHRQSRYQKDIRCIEFNRLLQYFLNGHDINPPSQRSPMLSSSTQPFSCRQESTR